MAPLTESGRFQVEADGTSSGRAIILPIDASGDGGAALHAAHLLAGVLGVPVRLLHLTEHALPLRASISAMGLSREELRGAVVLPLSSQTLPEKLLASAARARSFIALGFSPERQSALGISLMARLQTPLLVVRRGVATPPWSFERLAMLHDGREASAAALAPALELAVAARARSVVLHLSEPRQGRGALALPRYLDEPHLEWAEWGSEYLGRMGIFAELESATVPRLILPRPARDRPLLDQLEELSPSLVAVALEPGEASRSYERSAQGGLLASMLLGASFPLLLLPIGR